VYFAVFAASIGLATPSGSRVVSTIGMHKMVFYGAGNHVFLDLSCCLQVFCKTGSSISLVYGVAVCNEFLCWAAVCAQSPPCAFGGN
jgi:hypothetical protein